MINLLETCMARIISPKSAHFDDRITLKVDGLFHIIPFTLLRQTESVDFHEVPYLPHMNGMDRVIHQKGARSPGVLPGVERPWYMHPAQDDNLITIAGRRIVELWTKEHGKIETFEMQPNAIFWNGEKILDGPGILGWPPGVYHRNNSPYEGGSSSLNLAIRLDNFNIDTEFNIYEVDEAFGKIRVVREGHLDQPRN